MNTQYQQLVKSAIKHRDNLIKEVDDFRQQYPNRVPDHLMGQLNFWNTQISDYKQLEAE